MVGCWESVNSDSAHHRHLRCRKLIIGDDSSAVVANEEYLYEWALTFSREHVKAETLKWEFPSPSLVHQ